MEVKAVTIKVVVIRAEGIQAGVAVRELEAAVIKAE